ncbi:trifunctional nucleotide phosphoesterase protein YfkN-like isoform X2 [Stegodyphus dumicola]|nr:trifunctional nucleotide phosphoesterase protein YfkN-like isoform X2 [Stegodyphus dumicola]XP_035221010.1 trifunctional nucleotide phosphoesterase protein YfkN-like isoform X2 [Stegodyphus dumicola]XP_035221018.1 trifunctional nucleotide phosphoesterase protein YfkN-like isoform X2 [Stegodyphus dumicola]
MAVTILHFNDCYNVESQMYEPVGGAARFCTALKSFTDLDPLILFSGDIFAPSIMSTFTKGEQMVPVLNSFGVHCAVFGNHDFDFGVDILMDFASQTNFPWLISNVVDNETGKPLANGLITFVLENKGKRFGIIGLVEEEWLATLSTIEADEVTYIDFVTEGRKLAIQLKEKENVDYVIALTHMRTPNDIRLAENVEEIDLILGGHDHVYEVTKINGKCIIKSGTDFQHFSKITLSFNSKSVDVAVEKQAVTRQFEPDPALDNELLKYKGVVEGKMDEVLGEFSVDLDGRFSSIRTKETNLGNFICDIMLSATHSDVALLNSGTLRSDRIHPKCPFRMRDLVTILPMMDSLLVISVSGEQLYKALENGVSQYPKLEGRFPQVAGIQFAFDPTKPPGQRIDPQYIKVGDEYLDFSQNYRLVTKSYLCQGKDGYDCLKNSKTLLTEEECPELCTIVQNHFHAIKVLTGAIGNKTKHRQSLICLSRRHSAVKILEEVGRFQVHKSEARQTAVDSHLPVPPIVDEIERDQCKLEPKVEGRILIMTEKVRLELQTQKENYCNCENKINFGEKVLICDKC